MQMFVTIRNFTTFFAIACPLSIVMLWPCTQLLCNYGWLPSEMLYRHLGTLFFEETLLQVSSVLMATAVIILPIYCFKVIKMRLVYPDFFPTTTK